MKVKKSQDPNPGLSQATKNIFSKDDFVTPTLANVPSPGTDQTMS